MANTKISKTTVNFLLLDFFTDEFYIMQLPHLLHFNL